jgi:hypothetical protein
VDRDPVSIAMNGALVVQAAGTEDVMFSFNFKLEEIHL